MAVTQRRDCGQCHWTVHILKKGYSGELHVYFATQKNPDHTSCLVHLHTSLNREASSLCVATTKQNEESKYQASSNFLAQETPREQQLTHPRRLPREAAPRPAPTPTGPVTPGDGGFVFAFPSPFHPFVPLLDSHAD